MIIRMPTTTLMSEPCGMENSQEKMFSMFQGSNPVLYYSLVHYINLFSKKFPNLYPIHPAYLPSVIKTPDLLDKINHIE